MSLLFFFVSVVLSQSAVNVFVSPLGAIEDGEHKKILYRYEPSPSVLKKRNVVVHPNMGHGPSILLTIQDKTYLVVLDNGVVSFDQNQNGRIERQERASMLKNGKDYRARVPLNGLVPKDSSSGDVVFISTDPKNNLGYFQDMKKKGVLWDGTPFFIHSVEGSFHHPEAEVVLDVDRDNTSDFEHSLLKTTLGSRGINWRGERWIPSLSDDGSQVLWTKKGEAHLSMGEPVHNIEVLDVQQRKFVIGAQQSKPVVLDFWATWCSSCMRDHKKLRKLKKKHNVSIVGFADNSKDEIRRYIKKRKIRWPQISLQEYPQIKEMYPLDALPRYVLIDSNGVLLFMGTMKGLEKALEQL